MNVLVINSSPRNLGESKTALMLEQLGKGMKKANARVEVVNLRKKTVHHCTGCNVCWIKKPGTCALKDDMALEILPKFQDADMVVLGTPMYHWTINGKMKSFFERLKPTDLPYLITTSDGIARHPVRGRFPAIAVLSVCASFDAGDYFDHLSSYVKMMFHKFLIAEIYRQESETMVSPVFVEQREDILLAMETAGEELVTNLHISEETMGRVRQPLSDSFELVFDIANVVWQTCMDQKILPSEMLANNVMPDFESTDRVHDLVKDLPALPLAETLEGFRTHMKMAYTPPVEGDVNMTVQFVFSGDVEGAMYLAIDNGTLKAVMGSAKKADLTIETPLGLWREILSGEKDAREMLEADTYQIKGDASLIEQLPKLFA
jgi:FMN-dependent NADH-azoreductase